MQSESAGDGPSHAGRTDAQGAREPGKRNHEPSWKVDMRVGHQAGACGHELQALDGVRRRVAGARHPRKRSGTPTRLVRTNIRERSVTPRVARQLHPALRSRSSRASPLANAILSATRSTTRAPSTSRHHPADIGMSDDEMNEQPNGARAVRRKLDPIGIGFVMLS